MKSVRFLSLLCGVAFLALSGCAPVDDADTGQPIPPNYVQQTPPDPQPEMIPMIQDPQHQIWRPGYWALGTIDFVWVPGAVIARPSPTAVWSSAHWSHHLYGWSFEQGHWE